MAPITRFPLRWLLLLTTVPTFAVGVLLWLAGTLVPQCTFAEHERLRAPDGRYDLVLFSETCGDGSGANQQAALLPPADSIPDDVASFLMLEAEAVPQARWVEDGVIAIVVPPAARIFRHDDEVAGVPVRYR